MDANINTKEYWNNRFSSNNWSMNAGEQQTSLFMRDLILNLPNNISFNSVIDCGCALGDGLPIIKNKFPNAEISGMDFSDEAIEICKKKYSQFSFYTELNNMYDCIISSNVLEHLTNPIKILNSYTTHCKKYIIILVPYKENIRWGGEHINSFSEDSFPKRLKNKFTKEQIKIIKNCEGWYGGSQLLVIYKKSL